MTKIIDNRTCPENKSGQRRENALIMGGKSFSFRGGELSTQSLTRDSLFISFHEDPENGKVRESNDCLVWLKNSRVFVFRFHN